MLTFWQAAADDDLEAGVLEYLHFLIKLNMNIWKKMYKIKLMNIFIAVFLH